MSLGSPIAVLLAILFLIPGLLWKKATELSSPYRSRGRIHVLECLMLSCFNYLLASLPVFFLVKNWPTGLDLSIPATIPEHALYLAAWGSLVFFLPVAAGFGSGKLLACRCIRSFLRRRLRVSVLHPAPTAWDYVFARPERYWVRISLINGETVVGLFDSKSLASSVPGEGDVFLEQIRKWDEKEKRYNRIEGNAGIWISPDQIKTITFSDALLAQANDPVGSGKRIGSGG